MEEQYSLMQHDLVQLMWSLFAPWLNSQLMYFLSSLLFPVVFTHVNEFYFCDHWTKCQYRPVPETSSQLNTTANTRESPCACKKSTDTQHGTTLPGYIITALSHKPVTVVIQCLVFSRNSLWWDNSVTSAVDSQSCTENVSLVNTSLPRKFLAR